MFKIIRPRPYPDSLYLRPMDLIELKCKNCGSQLAPEDFSPQLSAVRCHHCNALYAISVTQPGSDTPVRTGPRPEVPLPKSFTLNTRGDELHIVRKWFNPGLFFGIFFALLWNGFVVFWNITTISEGVWLMWLFGLIPTAIGLGLIYSIVAGFVNATTIKASNTALSIVHGPVPWKGNKTIPRPSVLQVYCKEVILRGKRGPVSTYSIETLSENDQRDTLVKNLTDPEQALFVEQQIEKHLGIKDTHIPGELPR